MAPMMNSTPVVMSISSLDPSGCGGISASVETLASLGCHCTPIITQLVARDTTGIKDSQVSNSNLLIEQIRAVLEDIPVDLIHIGDLASISNVEAIHTILNDYPKLPVVLHPNRHEQAYEPGIGRAVTTLLFPHASIVVLNHKTAISLAEGADNLSACAQKLMEHECQNIFMTGIHGNDQQVANIWYSQFNNHQTYRWAPLNARVNGAGTTLSTALGAYLAHQLSMAESIQQAQQFTANALKKARRIGMGELLPDRLHWCRK